MLDPSPSMPLIEFGRLHYVTAAHHNSGKLPTRQLLYKIVQLNEYVEAAIGQPATVADLTAANLEKLTAALADQKPKQAQFFISLYKAILRHAATLAIVDIPDDLLPNDATLPVQLSGADGTLWGVCEKVYFPRSLRTQSKQTTRQYKISLRCFANFLGRDPTLDDLDDDIVTAWLKFELAKPLSRYTVAERLGRIKSLWNWLAKRRIVERFPTVQRPRLPEIVPTAMDPEQIRRLFEAASLEGGSLAGVRASWWWQAYFAFIWSTGERKSATLACRWEWVDLEKRLVVIPPHVRKGRCKAGVYQIWPEVLPLLERIRKPKRELVFPWPYSEATYFLRWNRILKNAGLPAGRKSKTQCLRVSHATWLKVMGGDPTRSLMHGSATTTQKHYIDPRQLPAEERKLFVPWEPEQAVEADPLLDWI